MIIIMIVMIVMIIMITAMTKNKIDKNKSKARNIISKKYIIT